MEKEEIMQNKIKTFIADSYSTIPDMSLSDLIVMATIFSANVAVLVSKYGLKAGEHVNVRTVIEDICTATMDNLDLMIEENPCMADDYLWPEEDKEE